MALAVPTLALAACGSSGGAAAPTSAPAGGGAATPAPAAATKPAGATGIATTAPTSSAAGAPTAASAAVVPTTGATSAATTGASATVAAPSPASPQAAASGKPFNLEFWSHVTGDGAKVQDEQLKAFSTTNPGAKVNVVPVTFDDVDQKVTTAIAGGAPPDIFTHGPAATAVYSAKGQTIPLDAYLDKQGDRADFYKPMIDGGTWKGKLYQAPWYANANVLVLRKDFFKEVGLDPAKPPMTWEELEEDARKLVKSEGDKIRRIGYNQPVTGTGLQQQFFSLAVQNGAELFDAGFTKAAFNSPEAIEALTFSQNLVLKDKVTSMTPVQADVPNAPLLVTGQMAMSWEALGAFAYARRFKADLVDQLGVAPIFKRKKQATPLGGLGMQITKGSKQPEQAWQLVSYLLQLPNMGKIVEAVGGVASRKSALEKLDYIKNTPANLVAQQSVDFGYPNPTIPSWIEMRTAIINAIEPVMAGKKDPKAGLDDATRAANDLLKRDANL